MKKILVITVLLLVLASSHLVHAVEFGVKCGWNTSSMTGLKAIWEKTNRQGMSIGAFASFSLSGSLEVQPEIYYTQKGVKADVGEWGVPYIYTYKMDYLEVPVLLKWSLTDGSLSPYLIAGPYLGFKGSFKLKVEGEGAVEEGSVGYFKDSDFGVAVGAGLALKQGHGAFLLEVRYTLGLSKINDFGDSKNRTLGVLLGYQF